jgi:hypothetical protein
VIIFNFKKVFKSLITQDGISKTDKGVHCSKQEGSRSTAGQS